MRTLLPKRVRRSIATYRRALAEIIYPFPRDMLPQTDRSFEFVIDFYGFRYRGNTENYVDARILHYGAYEKPVLYFLRDVMCRSGCPGVFVDVGANTGQHSMFLSPYASEVHAFEPYPPVLERFRAMVADNGIKNITIHPVGFGSKHATLPFHVPPTKNPAIGSFVRELHEPSSVEISLEIVPGDEALAEAGACKPSLLKIDVEGAEKQVLEGLARTIRQARPVVVVELSLHPKRPYLFRSEVELREAFPSDYELLAFDPRRCRLGLGYYALASLAPHASETEAQQYNVVAYPAEKADVVPRDNRPAN